MKKKIILFLTICMLAMTGIGCKNSAYYNGERLPIIKEKGTTRMIAHRGFSHFEKENTIKSFRAAASQSFYGMECDIYKTADNHFVISHDNNLSRLAGINIEITQSTLEKVKQIKLLSLRDNRPDSTLRIPTLEEFLVLSKEKNKHCYIELKEDFSEEDLKKIIELVNLNNQEKDCSFLCFYQSVLTRLRMLNSSVELFYLTSTFDDSTMTFLNSISANLSISYSAISVEIVNQLHQQEKLVSVWTVNEKSVAEKLISCSVDYITSDYIQ